MPTGVYPHKWNGYGFKKGNKNYLKSSGSKGKHWKISKTAKKKISFATSKEKNPNWKDGRSLNPKWISWSKNKRNRLKNAIKKELGGHTFGEWEILKAQYNFVCLWCKKSEPEIKLTEDHIIPLSKGGSDLIENIQPLCKNCNCKKQARIINLEINIS